MITNVKINLFVIFVMKEFVMQNNLEKGMKLECLLLLTLENIHQIHQYFLITVDEETIEVDGPTLHDPEKFSVVCMTELGTPLLPVAKLIWRKMIAKLMKNMNTLEAPDDTKIDIQLKELLTEFISRDGKTLEDVFKSKPFTENGVSHFKF